MGWLLRPPGCHWCHCLPLYKLVGQKAVSATFSFICATGTAAIIIYAVVWINTSLHGLNIPTNKVPSQALTKTGTTKNPLLQNDAYTTLHGFHPSTTTTITTTTTVTKRVQNPCSRKSVHIFFQEGVLRTALNVTSHLVFHLWMSKLIFYLAEVIREARIWKTNHLGIVVKEKLNLLLESDHCVTAMWHFRGPIPDCYFAEEEALAKGGGGGRGGGRRGGGENHCIARNNLLWLWNSLRAMISAEKQPEVSCRLQSWQGTYMLYVTENVHTD